jgi:hypothetical protein
MRRASLSSAESILFHDITKTMETSKINGLLNELCQKVGGKWLLTGGSLIQLEIDGHRATEDIDLVAIEHETLSHIAAQDELFKAAIRQGLSPESVNSAASFFVQRIAGWKNHLIELRTGPKGAIFRPDLTLFLALKLGRGTEIDLSDVASAVKAFDSKEFNFERFKQMVEPKTRELFEKLRSKWSL